MNLDWFRGILKKDDLSPEKYNGDWKRLVNWWNDHDRGVRPWSGFATQVVSKTASYTLTYTDVVLLVDSTAGVVTITLPTAIGANGRWYLIKDWKGQAATNNITIATTASQTIDGATSKVLTRNYLSYFVVSDGANWSTMAEDFGTEQAKVPTIQRFTSGSGTYTTPTSPSPIYVRVKAVGGGGGGSGSGTVGAGNGGNGGNTTFGATLVAGGGVGGVFQNNGSAGGTNTPVGITVMSVQGGSGAGFMLDGLSAASQLSGAAGGSTPLSGGAQSGAGNNTGQSGNANTGEGGQGGGGGATGANNYAGCGGGGGGYLDCIITSPAATYTYTVGGGGTNGTTGTNGNAGGSGGSGLIVVEEYYQ